MAQPQRTPDPWNSHGEPPEGPPPRGLILWLLLLVLMGLGIWALTRAFPGRMASGDGVMNIVWIFALVALVSSGLIYARRIDVGETLRNLALWIAVIAVLVLGYSFQDEMRFVGRRVMSEIVPGYPVSTQPGELVLTAAQDGHFYVVGQANGADVIFLIDTGASDTVLTPSDAVRLGIDLGSLDFSNVYMTANGTGYGADYTLASLRIGDIVFGNFRVSVNEAEMGTSLLGMSFLNRLGSFEFRDRRLFLRAR